MDLPLTKYELDRATGVDLAAAGLALGENARFGALRSPFPFNSTIFRRPDTTQTNSENPLNY